MRGKKIIHLLFFLSFLILLFPLSSGTTFEHSQSEKKKIEPLSQWSKQWLEEVVPYIITSQEKRIFLSLPNEEERGKFIESFWRKRDPNPETPQNEFKLEYYKRIALANKFFGFSGTEGWRTDRGKIYILLGPPNEIRRDMNPSSSSLGTFQGPSETWDYWNLQNPRLPYNMEFVFIDKFSTGNYLLERGTRLEGGTSAPLDLSSLRFYFDYMENIAEAMRNPFENLDKLRGVVTTQVTYNIIPLQPDLFYFKASEKTVHIPFIVKLPYSAITPKKIEDKYYFSLTLFLNVQNSQGKVLFERSKDINLKYSLSELNSIQNNSFQVQTSLSLEPEAYKLQILAVDNFSGKIGSFQQDIRVPEFKAEELGSSDILLTRQAIEERKGEPQEGGRTEEKPIMEISRTFQPDEELNVYFEVYSLTLNEETGLNDLTVEYSFLEKEKALVQVPPQKASPSSEKDCRIQTSFRLKNFKPGTYTLQIKIIDGHSGKSLTKGVEFTVI